MRTSPAPLADFWLDRYEVTNRQFKAFVDAGGYSNRAYWTQPFVKDGREISWEDAIAQFRDATGRPGPAGWELSSYPEGTAEQPVVGVSWYEAAAYAAYAGKSLPTYWHWYQAAAQGIYSDILLLSNFSGKGLARVGEYQGLGAYGTFDMAGNAKEWCSQQQRALAATSSAARGTNRATCSRTATRRIRSGASPTTDSAARNIRRRSRTRSRRPVERSLRDYSKERPANDEAFRIYQSLYAYDRTPLNATVEALPDDSPYWRREKITVDAAYGKERVPAFLFLPRNAAPPFQTVVFFPAGQAFSTRSSAYLETRQVQFLIQSGRAVLYPVYRGTFDRWIEAQGQRDESRPDHHGRQGLQPVGRLPRDPAGHRPDPAGVLRHQCRRQHRAAACLPTTIASRPPCCWAEGSRRCRQLPEVDQINFVTRVTTPVLMLNGRYDFVEPVETSQQPMFDLLATPAADKRHVIFETGHAVVTSSR